MALQLQRLGINVIRTNLRNLSLAIRNEKTPVTESSDHLPTIFITQCNKDIQTNEDHKEKHKSLRHTIKKWSPSSLELEKKDGCESKRMKLSEVDTFSSSCSEQQMKPDFVVLYKQSINDILLHNSFALERKNHQNNSKKKSCEDHERCDRLIQPCAIDQINVDCLTSHISQFSELQKGSSTGPPEGTPPPGLPNLEQLNVIRDHLIDELPNFFVKPFKYGVCSQNIVFENNIWGKRTVGIRKYITQLSLIRIFASIRYVKKKVILVKVTTHPKEGMVKVRWRLAGLTDLDALSIWKHFRLGFFKAVDNASKWTDGLSTFYVGSDGLIYKHTVDKVIPDDEVPNVNPVIDEKTAPVGLMSKTSIKNYVPS